MINESDIEVTVLIFKRRLFLINNTFSNGNTCLKSHKEKGKEKKKSTTTETCLLPIVVCWDHRTSPRFKSINIQVIFLEHIYHHMFSKKKIYKFIKSIVNIEH